MRPYLLKGHERPLNFLKFNREGDLLISCAKDHRPTLWFSEDGYRVGTYNGHNGAVWTCDFTYNSKTLITGSADASVKLWDVGSGKDLFTFKFQEPCRAVSFSIGDRMAVLSTDPFMAEASAIHFVNIADNIADQKDKVVRKLSGPKGRITRLVWTDLNRVVISASEDGFVRRWDVETGKLLLENRVHDADIKDMRLSQDGTHLVTASSDKTAKIVDVQDLQVLKMYPFDRPANAADISPIADHVVVGGGQEASAVTTTSAKAGKFESRFFHKIYQDEIGMVRGHFGPINAVAFHPDGRSFVTGGEDGYVRLQHFDQSYFNVLHKEA